MNAYEIPGLRFSLPAGGTVPIYRFVTANAQSNGVLATAGEEAIGVSMNEVSADQVLEIADGIVMIEAGGTVEAGDVVQAGAAGKAIKQTNGAALGVAITGATNGRLVAVKLLCVSGVAGAAGTDAETVAMLSYTAADLDAGADLADALVGVVPEGYDAEVISAQIVSLGTAAGVDDDNTSVFSLKVGAAEIGAATFNTTDVFPADNTSEALVLDAEEVDLSAGDVLQLDVTNGATANLPVFAVQVALKLTASA